ISTDLFDFGGVFTQGIHFHNTSTGLKERAYLFVTQFILGKANGLGDIEFAASMHAGEVGNYVWCDANENGIQDPTEFGIPNLTLTLLDKDDAMAPPVQTTTDADGGYVFTGLLPSRCYEIRIDLQDLRDLGFSGLTAPVMAGTDSLIDSDGDPNMLPGFAVAMFCTDLNGTNRHDIDFGFGGPSALDASKVECEDMMGCATFTLADIDACVDTSGINQVRYFPTFNDADSLMNEIIAPTITVCDVDTVIYARVNIPNDTTCFSIAVVTLQEIATGGAPINFNLVICPVPSFDALSFLQSQGFRGDGTTGLYSDPMFSMMVPNPVPIPSYPYTIFYQDTIDPSGCGVEGAINLDSIPASSVEAGMDVTMCGFDCVDLTAIGASFSANGSGATQAVWTTSGSGMFVDDNTFAGARLYCPDTADVVAGSVILRLQVLDDPCGPMSMDSMTITFETPFPKIVEVPADTIPCPHPFVDNQFENDTFPGCFLLVNCTDTIYGTVVDYETRVGDCVDIVKEIIRTHLIRYDKRDIFCKDTIRVQALDPSMFMCPPVRDSVYCHSGYLKDENGNPSPLETGVPMIDSIPIWPQPNSVCDVLVFYEDKNFEGDCPMTIHRTWYVKGTCTEFYETCEQWIMVFDTLGPALEKDLDKALLADEDDFEGLGPVIFVPTGTHGCEAHTYVPDVMAYDTCSGVKIVKAKVGDLAIVVLEYNEVEDKWESHKNIKIPKTEEPIPVIYEAFDSCHNVTMDTCYFYVKDFTKPVAICNKGVQVSLSDTMVWIPAEVFDEGSSDNCAISLMLARRSDWATACGVNLCDDRELYCYTEHHDSIWCSILETDKAINPVEAHYAKTLQWLCEDNQQCNGFVLGGWWWDLLKYGTLDCVDHPYPVDDAYFKKLFQDPSLACYYEAYVGDVCEKLGFEYNDNIPEFAAPLFSESDENNFDIVSQIGGGWSKEVPFCCEDACQIVTVELLVMDYWCNWSKCWTDVYVEDKTPAEPVYDLFDISISCNSYETFYADAVAQAQAGDFTAIDSLLGTYDKVSYDQYGNLPDKTEFTVYDLLCDSVLVTKDSL
ncbi:MAG: hypothetical protein OEM26_16965, partial [Saprospiraceae bacterium]|nr:hypothetical protein [Saprospiraceae bacterium]